MTDEILKIYKSKLIDTLEYFDNYCTKHNLNYYACSGTALGAIRHHDIIPWDDDIDVFMFRNDYNKLLALREDIQENSKYKISKLGDSGYIYPFAKLYDASTTLVELKHFPTCVIGVFIDIFPLDEVSGTIEHIKKKKRVYKELFSIFQQTFYDSSLRDFCSSIYHLDFNNFYRLIIGKFGSEKQKQRIRNKFIAYEQDWINETGNHLLCHHGMYKLEKEIMPKTYFEAYEYVDFGRVKIRVPKNYDEYLTHLFGDYMTPPPVEQQVSRHYHYYLNLKEGLTYKEVENRIGLGEHTVI